MHTDIYIHLYVNKPRGFMYKFLLVQQLPKVVTIDWGQVLGLINDTRSIIIQASISENYIKAE